MRHITPLVERLGFPRHPSPAVVCAALVLTGCDAATDRPANLPDAASDSAAVARQDAVAALHCPASALGFAMLDAGEVNLHVACEGAGPTLLLLHGYPEFHRSWERLIPPLVSAGYRVVVPDQRGFNLSDKPSDVASYQVDHLVEDIAGLVRAAGEEKVVLAGHDWGGTVAWIFAHRHPERVRGLIIMAGPHPDIWGHPEVDLEQAVATDSYVPLIASDTGQPAFMQVFDALLGSHLDSEELAPYHSAWNQPDAKASMSNWYRANLYPNVTMPTQVTVDVPTLVMWGQQDTFTLPSQLRQIPDYVPNLTVHLWPNADHWLLFDNVEETAQRMIAFERGLVP